MIFLPAALGPWLFPQIDDAVWVWVLMALTALNHGLLHFGTPLWLSWMGDYLPHKGLNHFWGVRHSSQQWTAALALLANALCFVRSGVDVRGGLRDDHRAGGGAGRDRHPVVHADRRAADAPRAPRRRLRDAAAGPFRHPDYRRFILYSCFWNLAAMVGAPFISMYLLEYVGMDLFHVLLLWTISWVGGAVLSNSLGQWAERFGQRPVIILCTAFKSINMFGLLLCPADPTIAFYLLAPFFMVDAFLNAGIAIANNGFMIKNSPRENRTMFVAAGAGFAGIIGGAASIAAGARDRHDRRLVVHVPRNRVRQFSRAVRREPGAATDRGRSGHAVARAQLGRCAGRGRGAAVRHALARASVARLLGAASSIRGRSMPKRPPWESADVNTPPSRPCACAAAARRTGPIQAAAPPRASCQR